MHNHMSVCAIHPQSLIDMAEKLAVKRPSSSRQRHPGVLFLLLTSAVVGGGLLAHASSSS